MAPPDTQRPRQTRQRNNAGIGETADGSNAPSPQRRNDGQLHVAASSLERGQTGLMLESSESWVEVASQPSSSSLSSIGGDIVTTGLRVGSSTYPPRRRRPQQQPMPGSFIVGHPANQAGTTSSQEEYDETESEEDRVMTSSTEAIHPSANLRRQKRPVRAVVDTDSDSDGDENATALGRPSNTPVFRPQPNAFSHPPSHLTHRNSTSSGAAQPSHHQHTSQSRPPLHHRAHSRSHRGGPNFMSPTYQADNDAALRASLTTLLSCAAAARGLPKADERRSTGVGVLPSAQPMELRLVPESELMAEDGPPPGATSNAGPAAAKTSPQPPPARTASNSSAASSPASPPRSHPTTTTTTAAEKTKRAATAQTRPARAAKKKRTATTLFDADTGSFSMSPTLLTWVVSAGVVVLVSVVGFGAGYVIGREVGRQEGCGGGGFGLGGGGGGGGGGAAGPSNASSTAAGCGRELVRSSGPAGSGGGTLRRIRWGGVGRSVVA
ncbi:hypothetical protein BT67DRAFT_425452 [Trichocladium antarcticum]|uniref:Uncharacterized protein n=1 Tax=Trichocladium antarcticum TaxID=1450529 RepID=A0AAN6UH21_9PEZI|nr:hypothetical protein BT67DRAFT_425452 [Trichocladium antarcticum]